MEQINANAILQFNDNQLQNVRKALGYEDVNKLKQDIELLADWIRKQSHFKVKEFEQGYLERLLIYNKGSIERTKQRFDKLCTCINLMPEFLQNFDIKNEFQPIFNVVRPLMVAEYVDFLTSKMILNGSQFNKMGVLPQPTKDNYRLMAAYYTGKDDNEFNALQLYRYVLMVSTILKFGNYMLNNDYCHGYEWILDTRNVTLGNITRLNPVTIHKGLTLFTEAMGQRLKKIHLITGSKFMDAILLIFKQALTAKLRDRLIVHANFESLHEQIPKEWIPKELGGGGKSIEELHENSFKEFSSESHIQRMKFLEKIGTNESFRLPCEFNEEYSGMPGSFKTLCVD